MSRIATLLAITLALGSPEEIAREAADLLRTDPNQWPVVVWYGTNSQPPFNGPAWRM
jgi:hypothetical protein